MKHKLIKKEDNLVEFECKGALENSGDLAFVEAFIPQKTAVILNMEEIDYINSCGFGALVEETVNFNDTHLKLSICNLNSNVRKTMELLGGELLLHFID